MDSGDAMGYGAVGAVIYGVIREIFGGIIQVITVKRSHDKQDRDNEISRIQGLYSETKLELEEVRKELERAEQESKKAAKSQVDCEKNSIRLEAKIELLTRLSGINLDATDTKKALRTIETDIKNKKNTDSSSGED